MAKQGRERIIKAAFHLFLERGYKGVGLRDIIAVSGLSKGAIYHHFNSKHDIYVAAIEQYFIKVLQTNFSNDQDATLKMRLRRRFEFFADLIDYVEHQGGSGIAFPIRAYFIFQLESEQDAQILEQVNTAMDTYRTEMIALVQSAIEKQEIISALPASVIAQQVMGMMEGLTIHHSALERDGKTFLMKKYDEVIGTYLDLLLTNTPLSS